MKSIKEKSNEYAKEYLFSSIQIAPNIHFEAGANYVLECIELYCNEHVVCNTNIKHLIEQLKK